MDEEKAQPSLSPPAPTAPSSTPATVYQYLTFGTEPPVLEAVHDQSQQACGEPPTLPRLDHLDDPQHWPRRRKTFLLSLSCLSTFLSAYSIGLYAPAEDQMMEEWSVSHTQIALGLTTYAFGFALAPMFLAPFSEIIGRRPVFIGSGAAFLVFEICCAVSRTYWGELVARFLAGGMASTFSTIVGGVVADIYSGADRNTGMTIFTGTAFVGTAGGPLVAGFIAQNANWRWVFWSHAIAVLALLLLLVPFFHETRANVLLSRRAATLNRWLDTAESTHWRPAGPRLRYRVRADEDKASLATLLRISLSRPLLLLCTEPIVAAFALFASFAWAIFFLCFSAIPYVFATTHAFSLQAANAPFAAAVVASLAFTPLCVYQERIAQRRGCLPAGPERRLFFCAYQALLLPLGLFAFGWSGAFPSVPWIVPALAIAPVIAGIFSIYLAAFAYLADAYGPYASSALAAQSGCRSMLAGAFPLFVVPLYERLGIGGASSLLGGLALALTVIPWVLLAYGPRIRARSRVCVEVMAGK